MSINQKNNLVNIVRNTSVIDRYVVPGSDEDLSVLTKRNSESTPSKECQNIRPCKRRWYIVGIFSLLCCIQACIWNTWGPISQSAFEVFPTWTDTTIATMANWGSITYVLFLIPLCWFMDRYGVRLAVVITAALILAGSGLRCITSDSTAATYLINAGQILNGIGGVVICSAPPLISANWFPPEERTTATAISIISNQMGIAAAFVLGPWIVHERNQTISNSSEEFLLDVSTVTPRDQTRKELMLLMYIEFGITAVAALGIFLYFPSKPPSLPSFSASVKRDSFKTSILKIVKNPQMWIIATPFCLALAVFGTWMSVLELSLKSVDVHQVDAGWIGFYTTVAGCAGGLVIARFTDVLQKKMKMTIIIGLTSFTLLAAWILLMYLKILPHKLAYFYGAIISMGLTNSSMYTLFFELAVEVSHPVDEGIVGGFLSGLWNVIGMFFLLIFFIPDIGTVWMNWCVIASALVSLPFVFMTKEKYSRTDIDKTHTG